MSNAQHNANNGAETMKLTTGTKVSGEYNNGIETLTFAGTVDSVTSDTQGGGFETARITLDAGVRFSWEKEDRVALLAQTVKGESVDNRFTFN